jgi:hypothetical protein
MDLSNFYSGRSGDSGHPQGVQILDGQDFLGIEKRSIPFEGKQLVG